MPIPARNVPARPSLLLYPFHAFFIHPVYSKLRFCHHMSHRGIAHRLCLSQAQKYLLSIPENVPGLRRLTVIYAVTSWLSPVGCTAEAGWLTLMLHAGSRGTTSTPESAEERQAQPGPRCGQKSTNAYGNGIWPGSRESLGGGVFILWDISISLGIHSPFPCHIPQACKARHYSAQFILWLPHSNPSGDLVGTEFMFTHRNTWPVSRPHFLP